MQRTILHCDLNNFFATVEVLRNPTLRGKPVAVCGDPEKRGGIVLAKSEEAKKHGIKTGDVIWEAKQKCPDLVIVSNHGDYSQYARKVRDIYYRYTDKVESFGSDECWLDITGSLKLLGKNGKQIADELREAIKSELDLTISVGVSFTKTFAKLGSDYKKPDATTEITPENFRELVWNMPVGSLLNVGRKSRALFEKLNIKTIGDLARFDVDILHAYIGNVNAECLVKAARGEETDEVGTYGDKRVVKSVGNGTTVPRDLVTFTEARQVMYLLCEEVAYRMRKKGFKGFTVSLTIRDADLHWVSAQESIKEPTNSVKTLLAAAESIFYKLWDKKPIRALRVCASNLTTDKRVQLSLFHEGATEDKNDKLSEVFDNVRRKHGTGIINYGTLLGSDFDLHFDVADESF